MLDAEQQNALLHEKACHSLPTAIRMAGPIWFERLTLDVLTVRTRHCPHTMNCSTILSDLVCRICKCWFPARRGRTTGWYRSPTDHVPAPVHTSKRPSRYQPAH